MHLPGHIPTALIPTHCLFGAHALPVLPPIPFPSCNLRCLPAAKTLCVHCRAKEKREKEERELERLREAERIRAGKELALAARQEDDLKLKRLVEARQREKEEEERARLKIKAKLGGWVPVGVPGGQGGRVGGGED